MFTLAQAKRHIDSISRPSGYSSYAWNVAKKIALNAWECHLHGKPFLQKTNYFCKEFYEMVKDPDGYSILPSHSYRAWAS